jgi:hypothetical protein
LPVFFGAFSNVTDFKPLAEQCERQLWYTMDVFFLWKVEDKDSRSGVGGYCDVWA